jgi:hypothetical protein
MGNSTGAHAATRSDHVKTVSRHSCYLQADRCPRDAEHAEGFGSSPLAGMPVVQPVLMQPPLLPPLSPVMQPVHPAALPAQRPRGSRAAARGATSPRSPPGSPLYPASGGAAGRGSRRRMSPPDPAGVVLQLHPLQRPVSVSPAGPQQVRHWCHMVQTPAACKPWTEVAPGTASAAASVGPHAQTTTVASWLCMITRTLLHLQSVPAAAAAALAAYEASAAGTAARERATAELLAASRRVMAADPALDAGPPAVMHRRGVSADSLPARCGRSSSPCTVYSCNFSPCTVAWHKLASDL